MLFRQSLEGFNLTWRNYTADQTQPESSSSRLIAIQFI